MVIFPWIFPWDHKGVRLGQLTVDTQAKRPATGPVGATCWFNAGFSTTGGLFGDYFMVIKKVIYHLVNH